MYISKKCKCEYIRNVSNFVKHLINYNLQELTVFRIK